jgi:hypothetical protein
MQEVMWIVLPFVAALGAGLLSFIVMQARMHVACQQSSVEERVRAAESEARRKALDEFLADVHVEERRYFREIESVGEIRRCLVLQERVCFRNIPLSPWTEHELAVNKELAPVREVPTGRRLLR